jgi:membrane associated rhomboid family serine protease
MAGIIDTLKLKYKTGSVMTRLIFINVAVFILLKVVAVIFTLFNVHSLDLIVFLGVPSQMTLLLDRLWTLITYMFVHEGFLHLLFNMLWLYWFGQIFLQYFSGRSLGSLYVLGGLAGALLYVVAFNTIPYYIDMGRGWMIGASASVMAIVMGAAFYRPDVQLHLLLLGPVKIVYIAIFAFVLDFLSLGNATNPGGHVAHIGGALLGYLFAMQYKKGRDITHWMSKLIDGFVGMFKPRQRKSKMKVEHARSENDWDYNKRRHNEQEEIDAILDKLKQSGYSSLSADEKKKLFDASKK